MGEEERSRKQKLGIEDKVYVDRRRGGREEDLVEKGKKIWWRKGRK